MENFKFNLGQKARIVCSGEEGNIRGRADYVAGRSDYLLHYKSAEGKADSAWFAEDLLEPVVDLPAAEAAQ